MKFLIADSFANALTSLQPKEQKAVKITVFDMQQDPSSPGLQFHRIDRSKDPNFWSVRVNRDLRIVVHKTADSFLVCYVDHHDDAYKWAERRRIEAHPRTGAAQVVEVRERIEEVAAPVSIQPETRSFEIAESPSLPLFPPLFDGLAEDDLLSIGVPADWVGDVLRATEDTFFDIAEHLPSEAAEALLEYASTGLLQTQEMALPATDLFDHPDAQRRFRVMENVEELEAALDSPWEKWAVFLHPVQRQIVGGDFDGPARVSGSAGTGKTVVALHRTARMLISDDEANVLLTTFSAPLSNILRQKLRLLVGDKNAAIERAAILSIQDVARDLFILANGRDPRPASDEQIRSAIETAASDLGASEFTLRFLMSEWTNVVDAWQIAELEAYAGVPRLGRKNRMGSKQRARAWPVFERARELLRKKGLQTWPMIFGEVAAAFAVRDHKPFTHIVVDEAQDLGVPELQMLSAITPEGLNRLFFAGDLGQRIFREPFSWKALGVDIRGRSHTLRVNYRTSHQIRQAADRLLPLLVRDVDGNEDDRSNTVSVFNGPQPQVRLFEDRNAESVAVAGWISEVIAEGVETDEIGVFVRSESELARARDVVQMLGENPLELSERVEERAGRISIGTMHFAKGLEFKAVVVMACDDDVLPSQERIETVADETELDEVYETERHLFYVACTRARDRLLVTGVKPASEFFEDLDLGAGGKIDT